MSLSARTTELLASVIGEIDNTDDLQRIIRKCNRTLKKIGAAPVPISLKDVAPGETIVIGTPKGEHTKVLVLKVNRKRVKVQTLEKRGVRKNYDKGTVLDLYPDMLRARA